MDRSKNGNLWQATNTETVRADPIDRNLETELIIVGGGFTGCSAALHAAKAGKDVVLLEARDIGYGGSGRNVGLVNAGLWLPPEAVEGALGASAGGRLNADLAAAPDLVFSLIETHGIECEVVRNGTLHCAHSEAGLADLKSRYEQLAARDAPVRLLDRSETVARTGTGDFCGALHDARAGTIQPLAYCTGLARAAKEAGASIHINNPVVRIGRRGSDWVVETRGGTVTGKALLVATNAYQAGLTGVPASSHVPVFYFQMATAPLSPNLAGTILPGLEGAWDTALIMSSFRKDASGRLIVGGMGSLDHVTGGIHRGWARRNMERRFPALRDQPLEHAWCGRIAMTSDHIPKIVRLGPNGLSIFGYSGRGIAPGTLFGARAAALLCDGEEDSLPVEATAPYSEALTGLKSAYFEFGASAYHAIRGWV